MRQPLRVTADNFRRAESDRYFSVIALEQDGFGKFFHHRDLMPIGKQDIVRSNRDALLVLGATVPDSRRMFGSREEVDPVRHLIGTAMGWGGNPETEAIYLNITPAKNDGVTVYALIIRDVPVDAFWSISVYNAQGYFERNNAEAYSVNNITAKKSRDGSIVIQFGGCDARTPNCLPITPGWNYMVRLYRPRAEILNGQWRFPRRGWSPKSLNCPG
jgi:hypothetical protein